MRFSVFLLASAFAVLVTGCNSRPEPRDITSTFPAQGLAITANPVGPVPGGFDNIPYISNPLGGNLVAMQDGRRLFNWYNCSGCHGGHGGGGMGPSLRDPIWLFGNHDGQIFDTIAEGRSEGMPAWGAKIPPKQIWELVAYIKSMGTSDEPDPPTEPANEQVPNPEQFSSSNPGTPIIMTSENDTTKSNTSNAQPRPSRKNSNSSGRSK